MRKNQKKNDYMDVKVKLLFVYDNTYNNLREPNNLSTSSEILHHIPRL